MKHQATQSAISIGASILGALFGRKVLTKGNVSKAGTAARSAGRASQQKADIERAKADAQERRDELAELEKQFQADLDALEDKLDPTQYEIEPAPIRRGPRATSTAGPRP